MCKKIVQIEIYKLKEIIIQDKRWKLNHLLSALQSKEIVIMKWRINLIEMSTLRKRLLYKKENKKRALLLSKLPLGTNNPNN